MSATDGTLKPGGWKADNRIRPSNIPAFKQVARFCGRDFYWIGNAGLPRELDFMSQLVALLVLIQIFE